MVECVWRGGGGVCFGTVLGEGEVMLWYSVLGGGGGEGDVMVQCVWCAGDVMV